jgi:hypothetical protein
MRIALPLQQLEGIHHRPLFGQTERPQPIHQDPQAVLSGRLFTHSLQSHHIQEPLPRRRPGLSGVALRLAGSRSLRSADPLCMARWSVLSLSIRYCGSSREA